MFFGINAGQYAITSSTFGLPPAGYVPDFRLPNSQGRLVGLTELLASGPVVLSFYPGDFEPRRYARRGFPSDSV